jgi:hypothetical protein
MYVFRQSFKKGFEKGIDESRPKNYGHKWVEKARYEKKERHKE